MKNGTVSCDNERVNTHDTLNHNKVLKKMK